MDKSQLVARLEEHFPGADIVAQDLTGGGDHWQLAIVAEEFRGKSLVQQHQLVYRALGQWMNADIHALALNTKAPDSE